MQTSYKELMAQRDALEQQIQAARKVELAEAVSKVRSIVTEFSLTSEDVFAPARGQRKASSSGHKVEAKYRNPTTGDTWTGRGKAPKWIANEERQKFLIQPALV